MGTATAAPNYRAIAAQAAARYGINPAIFLRQIQQESGFNPNARSSAGAVGIAQIVPHWHPGVDATNPIASLDYAAKYMATLVHKYGGYAQALSVYNSGNPNAYKNPSFAKGQTFNYVKDILGDSNPAAPQVAPSLAAPMAASPSAGGVSPQLLSAMHSMDSMLGIQPLSMPTPASSLQLGAVPSLTGSPSPIEKITPATGIAKTALTQLGTPYQWGGQAKLGSRTDCSGLLQASARANGVNIGRTTYEQWKQGAPIRLDQLRPGDAVFFHMTEQGPSHVAIYIGGGRVVEDPHTGASVEISQLAGRGAVGARRY